MSAVVTGASGLIGQSLLRCLAAEGRPVRAVDCDLVGLDGLDVEPVCADVRDLAALVRAFDGAETVYHLAARISIRRQDAALTHAVNVEGTRNVVVACERCGVRRLVHFSSIHALSAFPLAEPIDETRPLAAGRGSLAYDRSKAEADTVVLAAAARGLDAVIVTPTAAIGPHDLRPSHMGAAILQMARGTLPALVRGGFDWVDARDVARGALAAEARGRSGERYILSGRWCSLRDLAALVEGACGTPAPRLHLPPWLARLAQPLLAAWCGLRGRPAPYTREAVTIIQRHRYVRHDKAADELGYQPRPLEATVQDTVAWLRAHHGGAPPAAVEA